MKDSVIIVSGGMDSITLLHEKAEEIALAVTFDYGSNHNKREAECGTCVERKEALRDAGIEDTTEYETE